MQIQGLSSGPKLAVPFAALHCFQLENGTFSTGSMTVKDHMEANKLVVWALSSGAFYFAIH